MGLCTLSGDQTHVSDNSQGAGASIFPSANDSLPEFQYENVNHKLFGSLTVIRNIILLLHKLHYSEPNDWSKPLPTGRPNEMMAILTKRVRVAKGAFTSESG